MERFLVSQINNDQDRYFEFTINRELQFLKIIPTKSNIGCAMRLSAYGKGSDFRSNRSVTKKCNYTY